MLNRRGPQPGKRIRIRAAAAARTGGTPVVENGFAGFPETTCAIGETYWLNIGGDGAEFEIAFISGAVLGSPVYITDATGVLAITGGTGLRLFGKVSAVPGAGNTGTFNREPATGKMWVTLTDQVAAAA